MSVLEARFAMACEAVSRRYLAVLGEEASRDLPDEAAVALFAGTDAPAQAVLAVLGFNAARNEGMVEEFGAGPMLKAVQVQAFLLGVEWARRAA